MSETGEELASRAAHRVREDCNGAGGIERQAKLEYGDAIGAGVELELPVDKLLYGDEPETVIYKSVDDNELRLLIMKPKGWKAEDRRPAILWIHGGGWSGGRPEQFVPHCRYTALREAVGFSVQYRLIPSAGGGESSEKDRCGAPGLAAASHAAYIENRQINTGEAAAALVKLASSALSVEDCLSDCMDALRFIREQAAELGVDADRIVVAGDSAGGHLAACIGTLPQGDPLQAAAIVNCNGIVDVTDKWLHLSRAPQHQQIQPDIETVRDWFQLREEARRLSPLKRIAAGQPPSLTLHGLRDRTVEAEQSVRYVEAHRMHGNDARLILYPRSKHAFILFGYTAAVEESMEALGDIDRFLADIGLWQDGRSHPCS